MREIPWRGAARPLFDGAFLDAAKALGCEEAAVRAVWQVESAGRAFRPDGSLERRFEPHKMPSEHHAAIGWGGGSWRAALKIGREVRDEMLGKAAVADMDAALRATSWGGPQIMGANFAEAGFRSPRNMVEDMANDEAAHLDAFVAFVQAHGLDADLRARDWIAFARAYNGPGQAAVYAARIESAYRRLAGRKSPTILRAGDSGAEVLRLQKALAGLGYRCDVDGYFGPVTDEAVRAHQQAAGLPVDGMVGAVTWGAIERETGRAVASAQADGVDRKLDLAVKASTAATPVLPLLSQILEDDLSRWMLIGTGCAFGFIAGTLWLIRKARAARTA